MLVVTLDRSIYRLGLPWRIAVGRGSGPVAPAHALLFGSRTGDFGFIDPGTSILTGRLIGDGLGIK